jgi:hypothetical protein
VPCGQCAREGLDTPSIWKEGWLGFLLSLPGCGAEGEATGSLENSEHQKMESDP